MNIVYTIISLENSGGVERVVANKANWLVEHDHEVTIITSYGTQSFFRLDPRVQVKCLELKKHSRVGICRKLIQSCRYYITHILRLKKLIKSIQPDVISSIHSDDFYILPIVRGGSKIIFEYHFVSDGNDGRVENFVTRVHDFVMSKYDAIVYLTKYEADRYSNLCKSYCIANANSFDCVEQSLLTSNDVIAVGNLIPGKGFDRLISIWRRVHNEKSNWTLRVFGDGPDRSKLQRQIDDLALNDSVILMGRTEDIQSYYRQSSIFVSTSRFESFSMVLLEAQSVGLPCVSFDCPYGPREILVNNESGYLIPMDDDELFVKTLLFLMDDRSEMKRVGQNAYVNSRRFDSDCIMNKWIDLFKSI